MNDAGELMVEETGVLRLVSSAAKLMNRDPEESIGEKVLMKASALWESQESISIGVICG